MPRTVAEAAPALEYVAATPSARRSREEAVMWVSIEYCVV